TREEIEELARESAERPAARAGQRALAEELTTLVHGAEEAHGAIAASQALFGQGELAELDERTLAPAVAELRPHHLGGSAGDAGSLPPLANLMAAAGVVPSVSAARRAITEGGAYLNNRK